LILFCDTSALVKLYVDEDGSDQMSQQAAASDAVAVSRMAWVETISAMARRAREEPFNAAALAMARDAFVSDWPRYLIVDVTQPLVELAADYADTFALRAYDSVQLASAHTLGRELPSEVKFACFDNRLVKAARLLGLGSM
jgi:uncharacterized protein